MVILIDFRQVTILTHPPKIVSPRPMVILQPVVGEGSSHLTNTLHLDSVLVVPSLDYNLLSVSHMTLHYLVLLFFDLIIVCLRTFTLDKRLVMVLIEGSYIT